ncbi:MAG: diguanylate cyclase [Deltaproteobacteria bacterium]|nr:diguanylate cyclase [Deltaproteobacteria bacterium]
MRDQPERERALRILVAEDDFTSRTMLQAVLRKWGLDPLAVCDGDEAWEALQRPDAPRLVVLDWNMPGIDGIEVCRRARGANTSNPPYIIMLTSKTETADIVEGLEAGANDYVSKPYRSEELRARIGVGRRVVELQSALVEAHNRLIHEATHDSLTGVLTRRAVFERLESELIRAGREGTQVGVGLCDLDHFKRVNDTYGHQVGDEVLRGFVRVVQESLRGCDVIGRYGGEEFLVVAPLPPGATHKDLFGSVCERVAARPIETRGGSIAITVSIGVARAAGPGTFDAVISAADEAVYRAKGEGRNRVAHAVPPVAARRDA